jgi:hypothetical protein
VTGVELLMDAAGEDTVVADEGVSVGEAGCVAGKPARPNSLFLIIRLSRMFELIIKP